MHLNILEASLRAGNISWGTTLCTRFSMKWNGTEEGGKMEHWDLQTFEGDLSKWWIRKLSVIRSCASITAGEITRRDSYGASDCISKRCSHYRARVESTLIFSRAENRAYWSRLMKDHPLQHPPPSHSCYPNTISGEPFHQKSASYPHDCLQPQHTVESPSVILLW